MPKRHIEPLYRKIGLAIQDARGIAGLTQRQVSKRSGVSMNTINAMENGKNRTAIHRLIAIAKAIRVPLSHLLPE
jgi:transcriptional regulator with XRE-family HTH domain